MIKIAVIIIYLQFFLLTNLISINKLSYKLLFGSGNKEIIINNGLVNILDCNSSSIDCLLKKKILINNKSLLQISNVTLLNYNPSFFEVSNDSQVSFGNNTYLCFLKNNNLILENNYSLIIEGNVAMNFMGSSLELLKEGAIKIINGGSLIIKNGQINISSSNSIYFDPFVQLTLKNLKIELKKFDLNISSGSVFIENKCKITSKDNSAINFLSDGIFKILPKSTLTLKDNVTFLYDPKVDLLTETQLKAKQHFLMADNSSTLILDSANILAKNYGISFDFGEILIYNNVSFKNLNLSLPAGAVSFDINSQCSVYLYKSAKLTILGIICG